METAITLTMLNKISTETRIIGGIVLLTLAIFAGGVFFLSKGTSPNSSVPQADIVAQNGLHWHPKLAIYIKGDKIGLDDNIGLGAAHQKLHTHTEDYKDGVVHMEMEGIVTKADTKLGNFFRIWRKEFNSTQIFDKINGGEGKVRMLINGTETDQFENYEMKDGDNIEIRYE